MSKKTVVIAFDSCEMLGSFETGGTIKDNSMPNVLIEQSTLEFLKDLSLHNNREWFNEHKTRYLKARQNVERFVDALLARMNTHDQIDTPSGSSSLYRIYNDVRFSKDKTPYTPRFSGYLRRTKPALRGGYYFRIRPDNSRIACGFAHPNPADLKRIRMDILHNHEDWKELLNAKKLKSNFGLMQGDQVKTTPKGFSKDHPSIDLLRYKQYWFERRFSDKEVLSGSFLKNINDAYLSIRPFFDYVSEVLSTDINGVPIR